MRPPEYVNLVPPESKLGIYYVQKPLHGQDFFSGLYRDPEVLIVARQPLLAPFLKKVAKERQWYVCIGVSFIPKRFGEST